MDQQEFEKKVQERLNRPTGGVDPSGMGNFAKQQPKPVDLTEFGRKMYERVKNRKVIPTPSRDKTSRKRWRP
jgi:hypothetical protein